MVCRQLGFSMSEQIPHSRYSLEYWSLARFSHSIYSPSPFHQSSGRWVQMMMRKHSSTHTPTNTLHGRPPRKYSPPPISSYSYHPSRRLAPHPFHQIGTPTNISQGNRRQQRQPSQECDSNPIRKILRPLLLAGRNLPLPTQRTRHISQRSITPNDPTILVRCLWSCSIPLGS